MHAQTRSPGLHLPGVPPCNPQGETLDHSGMSRWMRRCRRVATVGLSCALFSLSARADDVPPPSGSPLAQPACPELTPARSSVAADRVLLVGVGDELSCALVTSLAPWGLDLLSTEEMQPGPSMPSTSVTAREMALRHGARVVVWLASDSGGYALWVYDAAGGRTVARPVPPPPFDASVAASLALSVKTTVRMVGLVEEPEPDPDPVPVPEPPPPPRDVSAPAPLETFPTGPAWQLGVRLGVRFGPFKGAATDARYAVELRFVPSTYWWTSRTEVWASLGVESGEWYDASVPGFEGRIADPAAAATLGVTFPIAGNLWLGMSEGVALHYVRLAGTLLEVDRRVSENRFDAVLISGLSLELGLGATRLVASASGAYWTQWQAFGLRDGTSISMGPLSGELSAAVRVLLQ